jgi:carbamoyl-phosphate synthase large subunit
VPRRDDIKKILIIGSGPIVIGQACEFDYSGTQACKSLREIGYEVVLVNSNPATIMTDPETADRTYIEPITWQYVEKIIEKERPCALLPTLGGQTGLNTAMDLVHQGVLEKYGVELIGANQEAIAKAEERDTFKKAMTKIGMDVPKSVVVNTIDDGLNAIEDIGLPAIVRPSFTLGGMGGGIAYNKKEFEDILRQGLSLSPISEVLLEESIIGWKEYEMEVMRDVADNVVIICSIENLDPMGVHTGDSITVAPAQTLTDKEYQMMRDATIACMREIGVETGGSNVQFAINPRTGRMIIIEMNPRVSRSSALASKATGFPIAKIAAMLAVGFRLDEIPNDITQETLACFEPTIDYVVTKIPRWTFEKFPEANPTLTVQMKSVGETMAIGRTFKESLQKALRGLEIGQFGLGGGKKDLWGTEKQPSEDKIRQKLAIPNEDRIFYIRYAMKHGMSDEQIYGLTNIDPWFLSHLRQLVNIEDKIREVHRLNDADEELIRLAKQNGFSDRQLAYWWDCPEMEIRNYRKNLGIISTYKQVDTCAAEFEAYTPYYYSTYESEDETPEREPGKKRVMILGGGPNRIGQGIEFDYCCCQAAFALKELGIESIMVNSNPETVSTDYDTSDLLFFEPLTTEDVLNICDRLKPDGVIVQFGGQTPLNLAKGLEAAGVPIIGTTPEMIDAAEDRERFQAILEIIGLRQPPNGIATDAVGARAIAEKISYPILVRPSYVLGGRAMEICYDEQSLVQYMNEAVSASPDRPILIDKFLEDAIEVDVDAISDREDCLVGGVMEHIEEAGVHSGDSACALPPHSLPSSVIEEIKQATYALARELQVCGLMNIQYAVKKEESGEYTVYILEVNPRASRTTPFVSKATGRSLAKIAAKVMTGVSLKELGVTNEIWPEYTSVKESVFPFARFTGVDIILGPEMRSTGEVMGISADFPMAFAKSQLAGGCHVPKEGTVFISMAEGHKEKMIDPARRLQNLGFKILSTSGTAKVLKDAGIEVETVNKLQEGRPNLIDFMANGDVQFIFNTPNGKGARTDEGKIRAAAVTYGVSCVTTVPGCIAVVQAVEALHENSTPQVMAIQDWMELIKT